MYKKVSQRDSFSLLGTGNTAQLALNGEIIKLNDLRRSGFSVEKSPEKIDSRNYCFRCAPKEEGKAVSWFKISIKCIDVRGDIWICANCSTVYEHRSGGKNLWRELIKEQEKECP